MITKRPVQLRYVMKITTIPNISSILNKNNVFTFLSKSNPSTNLRSSDHSSQGSSSSEMSSSIDEIQLHFGKMFNGLSNVIVDENTIVPMGFYEGEIIDISQPFPFAFSVHQTLSDIKKEMRKLLKKLLLQASCQPMDSKSSWISAHYKLFSFPSSSQQQAQQNVKIQSNKFNSLLIKLLLSTKFSVKSSLLTLLQFSNLSKELIKSKSINFFEWTCIRGFYYKMALVNSHQSLLMPPFYTDSSISVSVRHLSEPPHR